MRALQTPAHLILLLLTFLSPAIGHGFFLDLNTIYFSDSFATTGNTQTNSRLLYDIAVGIDIDNKGRFNIGWNVASLSATDTTGGASTTFTTLDMGPRIGYFISKDQAWSINLGYLLIATGTYKPGAATEEKLRGATIKVDIGYMPQISDAMYFGLKLNYYAPAFKESLDSAGTVITKVTYNRAFMFPSLAFSYRF